nr:TonB-dependent receptor plug domain-containing protein [Haliscomenobacter sp.]
MKTSLQILPMLCKMLKLPLFHVLTLMLFCGFAHAHKGYGQDILNTPVTLAFKDVEVKKHFNSLKTGGSKICLQFEHHQCYPQGIPQRQKQKLELILNELFNPLEVSYVIARNRILLKKESLGMIPKIEKPQPGESVQLVVQTVKGKITDEKGEVLIGANILLKGTTMGTVTNIDGRYELQVPDPNAVLLVSYTGFVTQEVVVGNRTEVDIILVSDARALDEVVVIGYGTQKKENLTGAVSTIDSKSIENRPVSNVANALQGLASGLVITRGTGQPGSEGIGIQIRGATSANGNVEPLVILDGVTVSSFTLQTLNPNDIENISVLKDAAAAAIYGAQAAGGVILITTKKGKSGKTVFDYSNQIGVDWALNVPQRLSLLEEAEYANLARKNAGSGPNTTIRKCNASAITSLT